MTNKLSIGKSRKPVQLSMTGLDLAVFMSEGNPGAISVLTKLLTREDGIAAMLHLDDMNIRGTQIWIGFKDHCGCDIDKFFEAISTRDEGMVTTINKEGEMGNHAELAVKSGAYLEREKS